MADTLSSCHAKPVHPAQLLSTQGLKASDENEPFVTMLDAAAELANNANAMLNRRIFRTIKPPNVRSDYRPSHPGLSISIHRDKQFSGIGLVLVQLSPS